MKDYKLLLEKFWNSTATEKEKLQLYKIVVEEEDAIKVTLQQAFEKEETTHLQSETSQRILDLLHKEIGNSASKSIEMPKRPLGIFRWAAALLVIIFASFFVWQFAGTNDHLKASNNSIARYELIDNPGLEIKKIMLKDGTTVHLYPKSQLRINPRFKEGEMRSVQLKGKANFIVKHDALHPFVVIANNVKTTDIGTEFCIDAYDEKSFKVLLKEGIIHVEAMPESGFSTEGKTLKPGDELRFDFTNKKTVLAHAAVEKIRDAAIQKIPVISKERLMFDKTSLKNVFARMEVREHIKITFLEEDLKDLTFTGLIEPNDTIETALDIICNLNGLSYHKTKQGFTVAKK